VIEDGGSMTLSGITSYVAPTGTANYGQATINTGSGDSSVDLSNVMLVNPPTTPATNGWTVIGGIGDDTLTGSRNGDSIVGGGGDDTIRGYRGGDTLTGGSGADTFIQNLGDSVTAKRVDLGDTISAGDSLTFTNKVDVITDFNIVNDHLDVPITTFNGSLYGSSAFGLTDGVYTLAGNWSGSVFTVTDHLVTPGNATLIIEGGSGVNASLYGNNSMIILVGVDQAAFDAAHPII